MTIVYLTLAWIAGILLGQQLTSISLPFLWAITLGGLIGAFLLRRDAAPRLLLLCLALGSLGILRMAAVSAPAGPDNLIYYNGGGWQRVEGIISAAPDVRDGHVNLRVDVTQIHLPGGKHPVAGSALVQAPRYGDYNYGDRIVSGGELLTPPEFDTFSYRDYLARQGIYTLVPNATVTVLEHGQGNPFMAAVLAARDLAQTRIADALPEPQASLLIGMLVGVETGLSPEVREAFNATGSSHVIAISGFNMTLIAGLVAGSLGVLWPARRRLTVVLSAAIILIYTIFVGADPSVVRAAIMSILLISAPLFHRRTYVPASLAFTALAMSILNPFVLWDVGFQLSFAAVMGMALLVHPLENGFRRALTPLFATATVEKSLRLLSEVLIVTLAAQALTLPLIAHYFGRLSLTSFLVGFLILPVQTPLLLLGGSATLIAMLAPALAQPFYLASWLLLSWTIAVVREFATIPGGNLPVAVDKNILIVFYLGALAIMILQATRPGWHRELFTWLKGRRLILALAGAGAVTAAILWIGASAMPDGRLNVIFLDSGDSNAVLIRTPDGAHILIDGGEYPTRLLTALGDHLPFWNRTLDLLILTQPRNAQIAAIPAVLDRYTISQVLTNGQRSDTGVFTALQEDLTAHNIPVLAVYAGYHLDTSDGVRLEFLHPPSPPAEDSAPDDAGLVMRLRYGEASFLLTTDLSPAAEQTLVASGQNLHGTVLQIANHGSERVSGEAFLQAVRPQAAVVQVEPGNRQNRPAQAVLERLGAVPLYRTDQAGEVSISTDGRALYISTEH